MNAEERLLRDIFEQQETQEDAEIAAAAIRAERNRRALTESPAVVQHLRTAVLHSDGRTESGVEMRKQRTPLLTGTVDNADGLYVVMLEWIDYWAKDLSIAPPMTAVAAWRTAGGIRREGPDVVAGFRAGTTPEQASSVVWSLAFWLLVNDAEIAERPLAADYQVEVSDLVWSLRSSSGLSRAPVRTSSPRPCPACGEQTVHGEFFGSTFEAAERRGDNLLDAVAGVEVVCDTCRWTTKSSPTLMAKWLAGDRGRSNPYMPKPEDDPYLTVTAAAGRLKRSKRTIETWISEGLETVTVEGVRYIETTALFDTFRAKMQAARNRPRRPTERSDTP